MKEERKMRDRLLKRGEENKKVIPEIHKTGKKQKLRVLILFLLRGLVMKQEQCNICSSESTEVKLLLAFLRRKILKQSQEYVPDYKEEDPDRDNSDGFSRLLVLIFGRTATSHVTFLACHHTKFSRYFRRKLKCDNPTFNSLCIEIANKLAERNYQLQTLNLQIGSATTTAYFEQDKPLSLQIAQKVEANINRKEKQRQKESQGAITLASGQVHEQEAVPLQRIGYWMPQPSMLHFSWLYPQQHSN